ncbi:MAG: hypothetical protein FWH12_09330 [Treponema sp.]|nr:hypothetical protein [Treponema sp.]
MKKVICGSLLLLAMALSVSVLSCGGGAGGDTPPPPPPPGPMVFRGFDEDETPVEITINKPGARSVITPATGDLYDIRLGGSLISSGTITINGTTWTFTATGNEYTFTGIFSNTFIEIASIPDKVTGITSTNIGGSRWSQTGSEGGYTFTNTFVFNANGSFRLETSFMPEPMIQGTYNFGKLEGMNVIFLSYSGVTNAPIEITGNKLKSIFDDTEFTREN